MSKITQGELFAAPQTPTPGGPPPFQPSPLLEPEALRREARRRLGLTLSELAACDTPGGPWPRPEASVDAMIYLNMAGWLPDDERDKVRAELRAHCARLGITPMVPGEITRPS